MSRQRTGLGPVHVGDNCVAWSVCGDICREKGGGAGKFLLCSLVFSSTGRCFRYLDMFSSDHV